MFKVFVHASHADAYMDARAMKLAPGYTCICPCLLKRKVTTQKKTPKRFDYTALLTDLGGQFEKWQSLNWCG